MLELEGYDLLYTERYGKIKGGDYSPIVIILNTDTADMISEKLLPIIDSFFSHVKNNSQTRILFSCPTEEILEWREEVLILPYSAVEKPNQELNNRNKRVDRNIMAYLNSKYEEYRYEVSIGKYDRRSIIIRGLKKSEPACTTM